MKPWIIGMIAGVVILAVVAIVAVAVFFPNPSEPTSVIRAAGFMELADTKTPPDAFLGFSPTASGNAGDDYKKAADFFEANKDKFDTFDKQEAAFDKARGVDKTKTPDPELVKLVEDLDALVAPGTVKATMEYTLVHTPPQFEVAWKYEPAATLAFVGNALDDLASYYGWLHETDKALRPARHMFMLGRHMMQERACCAMVAEGLDAQGTALSTIGGLLSDNAKATSAPAGTYKKEFTAIDSYSKELKHIGSMYKAKRDGVWVKMIKPGSGDIGNVLAIAQSDQDRAWRVQMIFAMGILNTASKDSDFSRGDIRLIRQLLDKYAASKDKCEAAAAAAAKSLTVEQINQLGNKM
jgi:hypothetical protein